MYGMDQPSHLQPHFFCPRSLAPRQTPHLNTHLPLHTMSKSTSDSAGRRKKRPTPHWYTHLYHYTLYPIQSAILLVRDTKKERNNLSKQMRAQGLLGGKAINCLRSCESVLTLGLQALNCKHLFTEGKIHPLSILFVSVHSKVSVST